MEKGDRSPINRQLEAHPANPFGEAYLDNGPEWHQTLPVKEQEDWRMPSHETRTHDLANTHGSPQLDPLFTHEPAQNQHLDNATGKNHKGATIPINVESHQQGHHSMASSNLGTDTVGFVDKASVFNPGKKLGSSVSPFSPASESSPQDPMHNSVNASSNSQEDTNAPPKLGKDSKLASESSDDDILVSSMPKQGQQSSDVAGKYSATAVVVPERNNGSQIQNPPLQVMKRPEDPAPSSKYRFPSHVFTRDKSGTQWSTASNESLFSIQMENMSFSNDTAWLSKSGELDKSVEMHMSGAFPNSQPPLPLPLPLPPQPPATKFNDISQSTAEQHEGSRVTEENAAETMREVIMETSITTDKPSKVHLTVADGATPCNKLSNSNNHSHHSDGSTASFAFKVLTDGDNTPSKGVEDKLKQKKQSEQQTLEETPNAAQTPKPTPNASQNKWLSCFTCCQ